MIKWKAMITMSTGDLHKIHSIVSRWLKFRQEVLEDPSDRSFFDVAMDLTACHLYGCPLDLAGLKEAKEGDFLHDLAGIQANIDKGTGKLLNCFLPRYSAQV